VVIGAIILTVAVIGWAIWEFTHAPEGWVCPYCQGEVIGQRVCPWCGTKGGG